MNRLTTVIVSIIFALVLAGGAFWVGMSTGQAQGKEQAQAAQSAFFAGRGADPNNPQAGGFGGAGGPGGAGGGGGFLGGAGGRGARGAAGTIDKVNGNTITVTTGQGDTLAVNVTDKTPVLKSVAGSVSDLKPGTHVVVAGDRSGNNISATGIQITDRPAGFDQLFARPTATPTK